MRKLLALTAAALALAGLASAVPDHPAWSQAARTIRVVISVPPGGDLKLIKDALVKAGVTVRSAALVGSHATRYKVPASKP